MSDTCLPERVAAVRRFSRFYTRIIGALQEGLLQSRFTLTEARVLYELSQQSAVTATELGRELALDAGYLSRILQRFEHEGLIERAPLETDRRQSLVSLSPAGRETFAPLDERSRQEVEALMGRLPDMAQANMVAAMAQIETVLSVHQSSDRSSDYRLRSHRAGDIGWVVARHGALYAQEYGFDCRFEALVAQVAGDFLATHDPARERCWIAEQDGINLGCVFLVRKSDEIAKLRLLIVEPSARGLGIGRHLVTECIDFARQAGYRGITLWTNDILIAARAIYQRAGFRLVASAPHADFGPAMVGEDWDLSLD